MKSIGVIGQGFVGSAVYEGMKNHFEVFAFDKDPNKFKNTESILEVISRSELSFLCVPTPMKRSGECDLGIVRGALSEIEAAVKDSGKSGFIVIIKSTIPPGTTDMLNEEYPLLDIVFNPEFLTEANAIDDYKNQNRIIIGGERPGSTIVKQMFSKAFPQVPIIKTSAKIAEMVKYVTNTFFATKVSFANEMHQICGGLGIDYDKVIEYAKYDTRLGASHWSVPGPDGDYGFGGHCFPKDLSALITLSDSLGIDTTVLSSTQRKNDQVRKNLDWLAQIGRAVSNE